RPALEANSVLDRESSSRVGPGAGQFLSATPQCNPSVTGGSRGSRKAARPICSRGRGARPAQYGAPQSERFIGIACDGFGGHGPVRVEASTGGLAERLEQSPRKP